jgi:hypothetical protein
MRIKAKLRINSFLSLILEGALNPNKANLIYDQLLKWKFIVVFVRVVDKIPHNGCRAPGKIARVRKSRYLG